MRLCCGWSVTYLFTLQADCITDNGCSGQGHNNSIMALPSGRGRLATNSLIHCYVDTLTYQLWQLYDSTK